MTAPAPFPFAAFSKRPIDGTDAGAAYRRPDADPGDGNGRPVPIMFDPLAPGARSPSDPVLCHTAEELTDAIRDARRAAARETEAALRAALAEEIEQRRSDVLAAIRSQLDARDKAFERELGRLASVGSQLALAVARVVAREMTDRQPLDDVTELMKIALRRLAPEPSIELRLSPGLIDVGETLFAELAREAGFAGEIKAVADPALSKGDAELRWHGGVIERRVERLQAEALGLVERLLPTPMKTEDDDGEGALMQPEPGTVEEPRVERPAEDQLVSESSDEH